jgi:nucleoside-diphosphate-sugar epimerase
VNTVYHIAAKPGIWGSYDEFHAVNTQGTLNVIEACINASVDLLIYTSSPSVVFDGTDMAGVDESVGYADHYRCPYPRTKALAEQAVIKAAKAKKLPAIVLRPHLIWGPGDNHLVPRIVTRARRLIQIGDGTNLVDTVYIDNAADAHLQAERALRKTPSLTGNIYFISQDEPVALWSIINAILEAAGKPPVEKTMSVPMARALGSACEMVYRWLPFNSEPPMTRFLADELATSHWFDISAAKKDLGYHPDVSIEEGLKRLRRWLQTDARF